MAAAFCAVRYLSAGAGWSVRSSARTSAAVSAAVPHHAQVDGPVGAERGVLDVDLDHGGPGRDQVAVPHGPHVQGAAPADNQVGALDQLGAER